MPDDYEPYETNPFEQEPDEEETTSKSTTDIYKPKGADAKDDLNLPFGIKLSLVYLKSLPGILKVVEFVSFTKFSTAIVYIMCHFLLLLVPF